MESSNNISSSSSIKSRFVLTHIDSEIVSFETLISDNFVLDCKIFEEFKKKN